VALVDVVPWSRPCATSAAVPAPDAAHGLAAAYLGFSVVFVPQCCACIAGHEHQEGQRKTCQSGLMSDQDQPQSSTRSVLGGLPQEQWSMEDSARFEAAFEVLAQLAAALTARITAEQNVAEPDQDRISALRAERASLVMTRRQLRSTDKAGADRILRDLGPEAAAALRR